MNSKTTFTFEESEDFHTEVQTLPRHSLRRCVEIPMEDYFADLGGHSCADVYNMVMQEVEAPLFAAVMKYTRDNQTKAAEILSISRGTLRKKLRQYDLL